MKKAAIIIYHRCDFDGIASYVIAAKELKKQYEVTPFPYNYGEPEPDEQTLSQYDLAVILDVCLSPSTMCMLQLRHEGNPKKFDCLWIDHHESSIRLSIEKGFSLMHGYRQYGESAACELTWQYFRGYYGIPKAVQYLSAYDIHDMERFDWENEVMPFQYGIRQAYNLDSEAFARDYNSGKMLETEFIARIMETGKLVYHYDKTVTSKGVEQNGFPVTIGEGTPGLCCLTSRFGSLGFEDRMRREGQQVAVCVNRVDDDIYRVSMYAPDNCALNLGRYMQENYGGGGHAGAASGKLSLQQFVRLLTEKKI